MRQVGTNAYETLGNRPVNIVLFEKKTGRKIQNFRSFLGVAKTQIQDLNCSHTEYTSDKTEKMKFCILHFEMTGRSEPLRLPVNLTKEYLAAICIITTKIWS